MARTIKTEWAVSSIKTEWAVSSIEDSIIDQIGKEMADDIDFEVLTGIFIESGWTKVVLKPMTWEDGLAIDGWVEENIKGGHQTRGLVWVIKDPKEANWFKLRWL